jgi:hypothetical protein
MKRQLKDELEDMDTLQECIFLSCSLREVIVAFSDMNIACYTSLIKMMPNSVLSSNFLLKGESIVLCNISLVNILKSLSSCLYSVAFSDIWKFSALDAVQLISLLMIVFTVKTAMLSLLPKVPS